MFQRVVEFIFGDPPKTFEFLRGWVPDPWIPTDMFEYILVMYFIVFQIPVVLWWLFFKKYKDDSFYPRNDTPKSPVDYL